jgi:hypothetical protein
MQKYVKIPDAICESKTYARRIVLRFGAAIRDNEVEASSWNHSIAAAGWLAR